MATAKTAASARRRKSSRGAASAAISGRRPMELSAGALRVLTVVTHPWALKIAGTVLVCVLWLGLYRLCRADLAGQLRFCVMSRELTILQPPPWIPPSEARDIQLPPGLGRRVSIFDPQLVLIVERAYAANPWVARVHRVEKIYPHSLRVELSLRKPVAAVRCEGPSYILIDHQAVRLPGVTRTPPALGFPLPIVTGSKDAIPEPGHVWPELSVRDGAQLAGRLQRSGLLRKLPVSEIRVKGERGQVEVELALAAPAKRIRWGRVTRPDRIETIPGLTDHKKLQILANALERGDLDGFLRGQHGGVVDIRLGQLTLDRR